MFPVQGELKVGFVTAEVLADSVSARGRFM